MIQRRENGFSHCRRCGRELQDPASRKLGYGPTCNANRPSVITALLEEQGQTAFDFTAAAPTQYSGELSFRRVDLERPELMFRLSPAELEQIFIPFTRIRAILAKIRALFHRRNA